MVSIIPVIEVDLRSAWSMTGKLFQQALGTSRCQLSTAVIGLNKKYARTTSVSFSFRSQRIESISSMNIIEGCPLRAILNKARTIFSASPTHFEVSVAADTFRNIVEPHSVAKARAYKTNIIHHCCSNDFLNIQSLYLYSVHQLVRNNHQTLQAEL